MTVQSATRSRERRKISQLAREYRRAGYQVIVDPTASQVPEFLGDYRPDLIALGDKESVVIEVKAIKGFDRSEMTREVASRVSRQPGWRFELVVTTSRKVTEEDAPWDVLEIDKYLQEVRGLLGDDYPDSAFLLLWATTEALLRQLAQQEGISVSRLSPAQIVKELATQGLIDRADYLDLEVAAETRNRLAHGVGPATIDLGLVKKLLVVTEGLREEVTDVC